MQKFKTLGDLLIGFRTFEGISQTELASRFDVDVRSVIRWEKNETLLSIEKEHLISEETFIPYQVIRNLNATLPIATFYDFHLRKYSLSGIASELPDAGWIKSRINHSTNRIRPISSDKDIDKIIRFTKLQGNPLKSTNKTLIAEAIKLLPELNMIIVDQSNNYSGHCVYFPIRMETYERIKNREIEEHQLQSSDLVDYKKQKVPVFYCHSITADCNENFFYIIGDVLKFYRDLTTSNYIYALLTSRYDSHLMSQQLGVKTVWEAPEIKQKYELLDTPRLVEGNFSSFLKSNTI